MSIRIRKAALRSTDLVTDAEELNMLSSTQTQPIASKPASFVAPRSLFTLLLLAALILAGPASAQQAETFGNYEVHYNALNTNLLSPEVAQVYGIQRAGTRAMLSMTVLDAESGEPVAATITAGAINLTGQRREIDIREIRDQDAIYYIGTFRIANEETLNFSVAVSPEGHTDAPYQLTFRQQFFVF